MFDFEARVFPTGPGCYLMRGATGRVLYVGKANNLRRRLSTYFTAKRRSARVKRLAERVRQIEVILTRNEVESLVLENNLIKHHAPSFNRALRHPKTGHVYIVLIDEAFPRLMPYRKSTRPKALRYGTLPHLQRFGPYPSQAMRDALLTAVSDQTQLRNCDPLPKQACIRADLGMCTAPCVDPRAAEAYGEQVARAITYLTRDPTELLERMDARMQAHAEALRYEHAQWAKERILALRRALSEQAVETDQRGDEQVLYFGVGHMLACEARAGVVIGMHLRKVGPGSPEAALREFLAEPAEQHAVLTNAAELAHLPGIRLAGSPQDESLLHLCALNLSYRVERLGQP